MCLSDNKLLREVQTSSRLVAGSASTIQILEPSPYRVAILIGSLDAVLNGVSLVVGPDPSVSATAGLQVSGDHLALNWRDHGPVIQKPWYANGGAGTSILVVESLLPAEWWPALLGDVPYGNIIRRQ